MRGPQSSLSKTAVTAVPQLRPSMPLVFVPDRQASRNDVKEKEAATCYRQGCRFPTL
jgi:hypothetical protein